MDSQKLFGTNGIRGIFGRDLSVDFLIDVAYSLGTFFTSGSIVIGYDGRASSLSIFNIVSSVLLSMGFDVYNVGLTPTPTLQYIVKNSKFSGGIMITASHNPPEYNGLKPISKSGVEISREDENTIEQIYYHKGFLTNEITNYGNIYDFKDALGLYIDKVLSMIDVDLVKKFKFKVVMDFGNGVQSLVVPLIAKRLSCEILSLNGNVDPNFSGRGSEPKMDNLNNLINMVKKTSSDFGVAYDGDGDRSIFCDETGCIRWGDKTASVLTYYLIKHKKIHTKVVCPINSSTVISKICNLLNVELLYTKVGSVEVTYEMIKTGSLIGFEENGGFFYGLLNQVRDGAFTTALILEMIAFYRDNSKNNVFDDEQFDSSSIVLSTIYSKFDNTFQYKSSIKLHDSSDVNFILDLCKRHGSVKRIEEIDGIKIWFDAESWIMFRPSGTEPLVRIYAESDDKTLLHSKINEYQNLIQKSLDNKR